MTSTLTAPRPTLRLAVAREGVAADAIAIVAGALLVAGAAQISIPLPFSPVPITGQTFAVVLVGSALGTVRGVASLTLYLLLGLAGLPFYADQGHGWTTFSGATGGYIVGFILAAGLTGFLAERGYDRRMGTAVTAMLTGNVVVYLVGLPWLAHVTGAGLDKTLEWGLYPFVPGDILKLYLAAAALPVAWKLLGTRR
jgi:biotin transport system substrate-specific component